MVIYFASCAKNEPNPNIPDVNIYYRIDPNSTIFLELNTVGGWLYLEDIPGIVVPYPSRGIIVYRQDVNLFKAYERQPPNFPFECCVPNSTICTALLVGPNYPFAKDTCTGNLYQLLDGVLFSGNGSYPMIEYRTFYDGQYLTISN
jgi:hypothetical protein